MNLEILLFQALRASWDIDTAYKRKGGKGLPDNQCKVTAEIIQDFLGGDILRCFYGEGESHYWNRLPDGRVIDLTSGQFSFGDGINPAFEEGELYNRRLTRYARLKNRVVQYLQEEKWLGLNH